MNIISPLALFSLIALECHACANHNSRSRVPNSFLGTVEQGCTPGSVTLISNLRTDPSKCDLPLAAANCNLCKLRLYLPEATSSMFLVQPLFDNLSTNITDHILATKCRCSEGCYFHKSSISKFGNFPLPNGLTGKKSFSEPFACYSGISKQDTSAQKFTFLIWCESDGGCPNAVVARYNFFTRFEQLSPNRPTIAIIFQPKITSLPSHKCLVDKMEENARRFVKDGNLNGSTKDTTLMGKRNCENCMINKECLSDICIKNKCVSSRSKTAQESCISTTNQDLTSERINQCVRKCFDTA